MGCEEIVSSAHFNSIILELESSSCMAVGVCLGSTAVPSYGDIRCTRCGLLYDAKSMKQNSVDVNDVPDVDP